MRIRFIAAAILAFAAAPAAAQNAAQSPTPDLSVPRAELKKLLQAQEVFYRDNNRYSPDLGVLQLTTPDSVVIKFVESSTNSYSASASIKGKAGASCVMMVGNVAAYPKTEQGRVAKAEGGVLCDGDTAG